MNLSFVTGFVLVVLFIIFGIVFDAGQAGTVFAYLTDFLNPTGMFIVIGGTVAALIACFPFSMLSKIPAHIGIIMGKQKQDPLYYINVMTGLSQEAREKGLLALEKLAPDVDDVFLRSSMMLIVDATGPDKVRERLENELDSIEKRHASAWNIYDKGASLAPGFGMVGTFIGLVNMLKAMSFEEEGGASRLAGSMVVALVTAFYGLLLANAVFTPIGNQLRIAHDQEMLCKEIIIEGAVSIQAGENPKHTHERLMTFLTCQQRKQAAEDIKEPE